jgi:hypothetical protein
VSMMHQYLMYPATQPLVRWHARIVAVRLVAVRFNRPLPQQGNAVAGSGVPNDLQPMECGRVAGVGVGAAMEPPVFPCLDVSGGGRFCGFSSAS